MPVFVKLTPKIDGIKVIKIKLYINISFIKYMWRDELSNSTVIQFQNDNTVEVDEEIDEIISAIKS